MAYDQINPPVNTWWMFGYIASLMANLWGGGSRRHKPQDFMPRAWQPSPVEQSPEQGKAILNAQFAAIRKQQQRGS